jgi:hypothetical protein
VWPRGIPVGTVLQEIKTSEGWARTYLLRPAVNPADVYSVMILRRDRVAKGVDGVWQNLAQVDQAAQRIVVSGDSAAKSAALAEAAARRAVLDSIARANAPPAAGATDSARAVTPRPAPARRAAPVDTNGRRDTTRRDTTKRDTTKRDSVPPPALPLRPGATR